MHVTLLFWPWYIRDSAHLVCDDVLLHKTLQALSFDHFGV